MKVYSSVAFLFILTIGAHAQYDSSVYEPLSNIPAAAEGIETQYWFPEHASLQFPAGDTIEALVGLHSSGAENFNVTAIFGSLNNQHQFSQYFYNFTPQAYQRTLRAGEEISLSYSFYVPYNLPPREFQVALTVFYTTESVYHGSTFFNRTIDVVERPKWVDTELLFLWALFIAALAGLGYFLYTYLSGLGFIRSRKSKRPARSTRETTPGKSSADEWLQGTHFAQGGNRARKSTSSKDVNKAAAVATSQ